MKSLIEIAVNSMKNIMKLCIFITSVTAFGALASSPLSIDTSKFVKPSEIAAINEQCLSSASPKSKLIAVYEIVSNTHSRDKSDLALQITLLRNGNEVAHQYPQTGITESWQLNQASQIKSTRFFDLHERAIEYQPGEKVHGKSESDWSYRNQLISDSLLKKFTTTNSINEGCGRIETKTFSNDGLTMEITWFPELSLINSFAITEKETDSIVESWSLQSVDLSGEQITPFFKSRYDYYATDYADIGDDHTDPFLTKMMNLGFIEHGASGFYDTNGNPMADDHNNKNHHSH
ncbi:hypothetical protein [Brumicola nitratireducens]|uniref:Putative secreted protein n=1 Tax=Glaciecola nitratireducens (strain JCM 12485 / KCTC 12276 / FR1064) TaxID=1085623 RepID=G4QEP6_GLANF|nr:hypothetical protein [Glaciecola nitratireducens]AEP29585.1 putative secreted protein [Glaciecola nitratireducens FR1064]